MPNILGIDPGMEGGAAIYSEDTLVDVIDLPTAGDGSSKRINAVALRAWILKYSPAHAFIEDVHSMPRQGISSSFRFGRAAGAIEAVVACCGIPYTIVTPQIWKKHYGLKGPDKEQSRALAVRLFPYGAAALARKKDHGRAEAALIASYGLSKLQAIAKGIAA